MCTFNWLKFLRGVLLSIVLQISIFSSQQIMYMSAIFHGKQKWFRVSNNLLNLLFLFLQGRRRFNFAKIDFLRKKREQWFSVKSKIYHSPPVLLSKPRLKISTNIWRRCFQPQIHNCSKKPPKFESRNEFFVGWIRCNATRM